MINELLLVALNKTIEDYNDLHSKEALPFPVPTNMKNLCISVIDARIEAMEADNKMDETEYHECCFLSNALRNGWLVSDIPMLMSVYEGIASLPNGSVIKVRGKQITDQIGSVRMDSVAKRFEALKILTKFLSDVERPTAVIKTAKNNVSSRYKTNVIYAAEYPHDNEFEKFGKVDKKLSRVQFLSLVMDNDRNLKMLSERDGNAREKDDYVIEEISADEEFYLKTTLFIPNDGQEHNDIRKSNKQVITEVFGEEVYDGIDAMRKGSIEERTVPIHHSLGSKWQKNGEDVLQMEFAGSGAEDVLKNYKGRTGKLKDLRYMTPDDVDRFIGKKVEKKDGTTFDYIRCKEKIVRNDNGRKVKRLKYSIGGASPNWLWGLISGLFNLGEYSIESTKVHAKNFAEDFLVPIFNDWKAGITEKHDIHISLAGHSRGAVAAGQAVKQINTWFNKYAETHPEVEEYRKYIKFDLRMLDPVPGMITNLHLSSCNLRDIPNVNTTVVCSLGQENLDLLFPLQHVKGAKKIVLTTTDHMMDIDAEDESQIDVSGDGKKHAMGYYDAETGEMYRNSGLSEMPDGVYICDEDHNLVRVTSYSQVSRIFSNLYENCSPQKSRYINIHNMVRDWFVENHLEMSFPDNETRQYETEKYNDNVARILKSPNKRLARVKKELLKLVGMEGASEEEILKQRRILTNVCRSYLKKTAIPAKGDSEYRVDLVADVLSFNMKETNHLEKKISISKNENKKYELDDKIRIHKERLENKKGYYEKISYEEGRRLLLEEGILKDVEKIAKMCSDSLTTLDDTRVGKITSDEYDDLYNALKHGAGLSEKSSIKEVTDFLKKLTVVSDCYISHHDSILGPLTDDGKTRLGIAKQYAGLGKKTGRSIEGRSKTLADKDIPIGRRIEFRKASVKKAKEIMTVQNNKIKNAKDQKVEQAKKNLQSPVKK